MNSFTIATPKGNRSIGPGSPCFIIAEMSANHNQDYDKAVALVKAAAEAGADAIKIQTYTPDMMTIDSDKRYFMVGDMIGSKDNPDTWKGMSLYDLYKKAFTPLEWHADLKAIAEDLGLVFFSTPYDEAGVDFLEQFNLPLYKVASYEVTHIPFLKRLAKTKKPIIMSVGFSDLSDIELAVKALRDNGTTDLILLHCTTAYSKQSRSEDANLNTMLDLGARFGCLTGFSDNNAGTTVPVQAAMMGATVIEKHIILEGDETAIDGNFSLGPRDLKAMVVAIRESERVLGQVKYGFKNESEKNNAKYQRSIFVVKDIKAGEKFTAENIRVIRPNLGLQPKYYEETLGKICSRDIERGEPLTEDIIK
ncbi:MAG: pseudaminic acid synthase [bacterium]|nr:pseudaminic acid synthase [bacterium]